MGPALASLVGCLLAGLGVDAEALLLLEGVAHLGELVAQGACLFGVCVGELVFLELEVADAVLQLGLLVAPVGVVARLAAGAGLGGGEVVLQLGGTVAEVVVVEAEALVVLLELLGVGLLLLPRVETEAGTGDKSANGERPRGRVRMTGKVVGGEVSSILAGAGGGSENGSIDQKMEGFVRGFSVAQQALLHLQLLDFDLVLGMLDQGVEGVEVAVLGDVELGVLLAHAVGAQHWRVGAEALAEADPLGQAGVHAAGQGHPFSVEAGR